MAIVSAHGPRHPPLHVSFERRYVEHFAAVDQQCNDSHCDLTRESPAAVTPPSPAAQFLTEYSTRRRLRDCIPGWACQYADCPQCGKRVARRARADMLARFSDHPHCISLRLSVELAHDLDLGHADLSRARSVFHEKARLSRTTRGYLRSTEITRVGARWNWHDHLIVIPVGNSAAEAHRLLDHWHDACRQIGLEPSTHSRRSHTPDAIKYVLKERLGAGETSLAELLDLAARGDADAADDWIEWDEWRRLHPRVRFRYSWISPETTEPSQAPATPRDQHIVSVGDRELAQLAILTSLGVSSKPQQADALGVSCSWISRRRRHAPDALPGLIPFRVTERGDQL